MKRVIIGLLILGIAAPAFADDDSDYPLPGLRKIDEITALYGPPAYLDTGDPKRDIQDYMDRQRSYDDSVGRLTIDNQRKTDEILERQERILRKLGNRDDY